MFRFLGKVGLSDREVDIVEYRLNAIAVYAGAVIGAAVVLSPLVVPLGAWGINRNRKRIDKALTGDQPALSGPITDIWLEHRLDNDVGTAVLRKVVGIPEKSSSTVYVMKLSMRMVLTRVAAILATEVGRTAFLLGAGAALRRSPRLLGLLSPNSAFATDLHHSFLEAYAFNCSVGLDMCTALFIRRIPRLQRYVRYLRIFPAFQTTEYVPLERIAPMQSRLSAMDITAIQLVLSFLPKLGSSLWKLVQAKRNELSPVSSLKPNSRARRFLERYKRGYAAVAAAHVAMVGWRLACVYAFSSFGEVPYRGSRSDRFPTTLVTYLFYPERGFPFIYSFFGLAFGEIAE
jgi:hypothetical protein